MKGMSFGYLAPQTKKTFNKKFVYLASSVAAIGGLLFGFDIAIISGTIHFFSNHFELNEYQTGWAVGCISLGAGAGALAAGKLSDLIGRKKLLLISAFLFALTGVGTGWASNFFIFISFRILSGFAIGSAALVCPMYISEISPAPIRGRLISFYQLSITFGVLLAYYSNYMLLDTGVNNWRWMLSSQSVPAIFFFLFIFFVPESPRWLVYKNRKLEARNILKKIGGPEYSALELLAIEKSYYSEYTEDLNSIFKKGVFHIIIIGVVVAFFSQTGGPIISYGPEIYKKIGLDESSAFIQSVLVGFVLMMFTLVAIVTIDKIGRRKLLLYGVFLIIIDTSLLAISLYFEWPAFWHLFFLIAFIAIYAATIGPITWVLLSEIFPNNIRGIAMSIATLSLWVANFSLLGLFPVMKVHLGLTGTFGIYSVMFISYFIFIFLKIPETKNRTLEEIEFMLTKTNKP